MNNFKLSKINKPYNYIKTATTFLFNLLIYYHLYSSVHIILYNALIINYVFSG